MISLRTKSNNICDLKIMLERLSKYLNCDISSFHIEVHKTGVWGNTLYKIKTYEKKFLYKQFNAFDDVSITYNPPKVSPEKRLETSIYIQNLAFSNIGMGNVIIPQIYVASDVSYIMEYIDSSYTLKELLDSGNTISKLKDFGKSIAKFHSKCVDSIGVNMMLKYKMNLQYKPPKNIKLNDEELYIYRILKSECFSSKFPSVLIHGDLNAKNILVTKNSEIVLIDFEHAGLGKRVYDIAYMIADIVISLSLYPYRKEYIYIITTFLLDYINESKLDIKELSFLWGHVGVQILYRLTGPSAIFWTQYFSKIQLEKLEFIGKKLLTTHFSINEIYSTLNFVIL